MNSLTPNNDFPSLLDSEKGDGDVDKTQQAISKTPPAPIKRKVFRTYPPIVSLDRMVPSPILVSFTLVCTAVLCHIISGNLCFK